MSKTNHKSLKSYICMKYALILLLAGISMASCDTSTNNINLNQNIQFEANWTTNAYYCIRKNGQIIGRSNDSIGTVWNNLGIIKKEQNDLIEITVTSLDATGHPDHARVHAAIISDGYRQASNTNYGTVYLYY